MPSFGAWLFANSYWRKCWIKWYKDHKHANIWYGATGYQKALFETKRIQQDADYDKNWSDEDKIKNILSKYNLKNPINGYVIATTGKGQINTQLQNNPMSFSQAEQNAQFLIPASEEKHAVFIDDDYLTYTNFGLLSTFIIISNAYDVFVTCYKKGKQFAPYYMVVWHEMK